jgi:hypothetical protein
MKKRGGGFSMKMNIECEDDITRCSEGKHDADTCMELCLPEMSLR